MKIPTVMKTKRSQNRGGGVREIKVEIVGRRYIMCTEGMEIGDVR